MTDYTKLAERILARGFGQVPDWEINDLARALLACDRERQTAMQHVEDIAAAFGQEQALAQTYRDALAALMLAEPDDHAAIQDRCAWGDPKPHACVWCVARAALAAEDKT